MGEPIRRLCCGTCYSWRGDLFDAGECWSLDRLDGDLRRGPAGYSNAGQMCEAWLPSSGRFMSAADMLRLIELDRAERLPTALPTPEARA